jgi:hypothetical protein
MLSEAERAVLNTALEKYRPGLSEPIFVGGHKVFKPALRLMKLYRLAIDEIQDGQAVTRYTRWIDAVEGMSLRSRPILDCAASTLFACTVGRKTTSRPAPSAFLWNSFERSSGWNRCAMLTEISSDERHYRFGQTCAREPWIQQSGESTPRPTCTSSLSRWSDPRMAGSQR